MDSGSHASPNVRLTYASDADPAKVQEYIENDANNPDRLTYGIPFSRAKRQNLIHGDGPLLQRVRDLCTSKGCAQSAYDAINAGTPVTSDAVGAVKRACRNANIFQRALGAAQELFSRERDGVGAEINISPRARERDLQDRGYKTYDSDNYINYD